MGGTVGSDFPPKLPLRGVGGHIEGTVGASLRVFLFRFRLASTFGGSWMGGMVGESLTKLKTIIIGVSHILVYKVKQVLVILPSNLCDGVVIHMVNTDRDLNQFGERIRKQMGDRERDERKRQMQRPVQRYGAAAGRSASQKQARPSDRPADARTRNR